MFLQFFCHTTGALNLHIIPGIDVNLLNPIPVNVFGQKTKFSHLGIDPVNQFFRCHALNRNTLILNILGRKPPDLMLAFLRSILRDQTAVLLGQIPLNFPEYLRKRSGFFFLKKKGMTDGWFSSGWQLDHCRDFLILRRAMIGTFWHLLFQCWYFRF